MVETGFFYGNFIDPILTGVRKKVCREVYSNETVLDIACGTGAQVFQLAKKVKFAAGIDLSESMINYARVYSKKQQIRNVAFVVGDVTQLLPFADKEFDVATISLALHQFSPDLYEPVLSEMKRVAKRIIIVDYAIPLPNNCIGLACKIIEFLAGKEHNRCFKMYFKLGGLQTILLQNGLKPETIKYMGKGAVTLLSCNTI